MSSGKEVEEYEAWPDFGQAKPDDWDPQHWLAAQMILRGETQIVVAEKLGRSTGTISNMVRRWRKRYGPEFLKAETIKHLTTAGPTNATGPRAWPEVKALEAPKFAEAAVVARELAVSLLQDYLTGRRDRSHIGIPEIERLSRIAKNLADTATNLSPDPGSQGGPGNVAPGLLDGFETKPGQHSDMLLKLDTVTAQFRVEKVGPAPSEILGADGALEVGEATEE